MNVKKYLIVAGNSLQEYFVYRLNFILWRVRVVVSMLITYFLWFAVFAGTKQVFGYGESQMLTYVLLLSFMNSLVLSTQTFRMGDEINMGVLSMYLIRPVNYFLYNLARDVSDKVLNMIFSILEFIILIILLRPPVIVQSQPSWWFLFLCSTALASILYFEIGIILSSIAFWSYETWAPRFIFFILVSFLAGNYFPIDILPGPIYHFLTILPFTYLIFFPLKLYLGEANGSFIFLGFTVVSFWIVLLYFFINFLWMKGLKAYTAEGQ